MQSLLEDEYNNLSPKVNHHPYLHPMMDPNGDTDRGAKLSLKNMHKKWPLG